MEEAFLEREGDGGLDLDTRLALEFDPRLADVWLSVWTSRLDDRQIGAHLAVLLRMAYLTGYQDAVCEPEPGELFRRLGLPVPPRHEAGHLGSGGGG